jgi:hypothetical protein
MHRISIDVLERWKVVLMHRRHTQLVAAVGELLRHGARLSLDPADVRRVVITAEKDAQAI